MKKLKFACLALAIAANAFAGTGEGGGHPLEARVKNKLTSIMNDILLMSDAAKAKLNFNYQGLNSIIKLEVLTLCATEEQLPTLKEQNKLAFVFKTNSRIIRLDCSLDADIQSQWNKKLESTDDVDHIFFIHEALRAQNIVNDDNYEYSSSYSEAYRKNTLDQNDRLFRLMHTRNNDCSLSFEQSEGKNVVNLLIQGKVVNTYVAGVNESLLATKANFLNASGPQAFQARKLILFKAQENRCFN